MKFKMTAAAILKLLFLSILVKWSISGGSCLHYCKIAFICVNQRGSVIAVCAKIQDGGSRHLEIQFCNARPPTKSLCAPDISLQISC